MDLAGLAVEKLGRADNFSSKRNSNGLVSQANTQNRKLSREALDQLDADARLPRRARTGRNDYFLRLAPRDFLDGNLIVAVDLYVATQLAQILRQVVGERIV